MAFLAFCVFGSHHHDYDRIQKKEKRTCQPVDYICLLKKKTTTFFSHHFILTPHTQQHDTGRHGSTIFTMMFPVLPGSTPIGVDSETAAGAQGVLAAPTQSPPLPLKIGTSVKHLLDTKATIPAKKRSSTTRRAAVVAKPGTPTRTSPRRHAAAASAVATVAAAVEGNKGKRKEKASTTSSTSSSPRRGRSAGRGVVAVGTEKKDDEEVIHFQAGDARSQEGVFPFLCFVVRFPSFYIRRIFEVFKHIFCHAAKRRRVVGELNSTQLTCA